MNINDAIAILNKSVPRPQDGLPDEVFLYISRTTPLVNVDLLVKDETGRTLLSWRHDQYAQKGWHVPGGIIRVKETFEDRIKKVAQDEIGTDLTFAPIPLAINQLIHPDNQVRCHFISILYKCFLPSTFTPKNKGLQPGDEGYLMWHNSCPVNIIKCHEIYRKFIQESD